MNKYLLISLLALGLSGCTNENQQDILPIETLQEPLGIHEVDTQEAPEKMPEVVETNKPGKQAIKVTKFFDFGCGYCRRGAQTMKALEEKYGDKVEIQLMHFLIHPQVAEAHKASECAGEQGQFEAFFYDYFERNYGTVDQKGLRKMAQGINLNLKQYDQCMTRPMSANVDAHYNLGSLLGVTGTPFFLVNDNIPLRGAASYDQFVTIIDGLLASE